jgi:hypothetical protein
MPYANHQESHHILRGGKQGYKNTYQGSSYSSRAQARWILQVVAVVVLEVRLTTLKVTLAALRLGNIF